MPRICLLQTKALCNFYLLYWVTKALRYVLPLQKLTLLWQKALQLPAKLSWYLQPLH